MIRNDVFMNVIETVVAHTAGVSECSTSSVEACFLVTCKNYVQNVACHVYGVDQYDM